MKIIFGILGEKLAGKDTVANYLEDKYGAEHIKASQILDELLFVLSIPVTRRNEIDAGRGMESVFGSTVIGQAIVARVLKSQKHIIVINGLRIKNQFEDAKAMGSVIVYITAPPELRYKRSLERISENKDGQPSFQEFLHQDTEWTEKNIPVFGKQANYKIENTGSLEDLYKEIDRIIKLHVKGHI